MERKNETAKENETSNKTKRINNKVPDANVMITLKIILLTMTFAAMSKDIFQV